MASGTISAGFAKALLDLAVAKGADRRELARRAGIDANELLDQDNRVPFERYIALMRAGKELARDPALALHFGEAYDMAELLIVGLLGQACETAADAFAQLGRYNRLIADVAFDGTAAADRLVLAREGGELWLLDVRKNPNAFIELTESSFARMVSTARRYAPGTAIIKEVHVTHPAPPYRAEYDRVFQLPVFFDSDRNGLLMTGNEWMSMKIGLPSRYVFGVLSDRADALLRDLENSKTTRGRVESVLIPILHTGEASMDAVANRMAVSRQTLFRRLKAEGVTFEKVLDELRHQLALNYLSGKKVSVNETAYLVGFSDPAAFSRAFKRWTGRNPSAVRSAPADA